MEIWQLRRKCTQRSCVSAAMAVLLLMPCAASAESIRLVDCEDAGVSISSGAWIEPATTEAVELRPSPSIHQVAFQQVALCELWTEATLHAATWQRAKACGDEGDLRNLHLAPEPSGLVLALMGMLLSWRRLRSKLRG